MRSGSFAARQVLEARLTAACHENEVLKGLLSNVSSQLTGIQAQLSTADVHGVSQAAAQARAHVAPPRGATESLHQEARTAIQNDQADLESRLQAAEQALAVVQNERADLEARLQASKWQHEQALAVVQKERADLEARLQAADWQLEQALAVVQKDKADLEARLQAAETDRLAVKKDYEIKLLCANPFFRVLWSSVHQELAPMVVVSFHDFQNHGSVPRSDGIHTTPFLDLPLSAKVVFVSHRWLRPSADPAAAHPDSDTGAKHALLCSGIRQLALTKGWDLHNTHLWMDYFSIEQDDVEKKLAGIASLRGYVAACNEVIVPCVEGDIGGFVSDLPGEYGERAWTRLEAFTFYATAALAPAGERRIYACSPAGDPDVAVIAQRMHVGTNYLPSTGKVFNEGDMPAIQEHETVMRKYLMDSLEDPEICFRFLSKGMVAGIKEISKYLPAAAKKGEELGLLIETEKLSFEGCELRSEGAKALASAFKPMQKGDSKTWVFHALKELDFTRQDSVYDIVPSILEALAPRENPNGSWVFSNITVLSLYDLAIGTNSKADDHPVNKALSTFMKARKGHDGYWAFGPIHTLELGYGAKDTSKGNHMTIAPLFRALTPQENPDGHWSFPSLTHLNLSGCAVRESFYEHEDLREAMKAALEPRQNGDKTWAMCSLQTLHLLRTKQNSVSAEAIAAGLEPRQNPDSTWVFPALEYLDLTDNQQIGLEGWSAIASALAPRESNGGDSWTHNPTFTALHLDRLSGDAASSLASALVPREQNGSWFFNSALHTLTLPGGEYSSGGIGDVGATAIAAILEPRKMPDSTWMFQGALAILDLADNKIGIDGAKALGAALAPRENPDGTWVFNTALRLLNLNDNEIRKEGGAAIADAIAPRPNPDGTWAFNESLEELFLHGSFMVDVGAKAMAAALEPKWSQLDRTWARLPLKKLNLGSSGIREEGAKAIAAALKPRQNPDGNFEFKRGLERLNLSDNYIQSPGGEALASALEPVENLDGSWSVNETLEFLYVGNCGFRVKSIFAAAREEKQNADGTRVCNRVSVRDVTNIRGSLRNDRSKM